MYNIEILNTEEYTNISSKKIHNICRACLKEEGTIDLYESKHKDLSFRDIFTIFSIFQAYKEDSYPQQICQLCADLMVQFYCFKEKVAKNQFILQIASTNINNLDNLKEDDALENCDRAIEISDDDNDNVLTMTENIEFIDYNTILGNHEKKEDIILRREHDNSQDFTCSCCLRKFDNQDDLISHRMREAKQTEQNEKADYTCLNCYLKFQSRTEFMDHIRDTAIPGQNEFVCPKCFKKFDSEFEFLKHRREEKAQVSRKKEHACKKCNLKFRTLRELKIHRKLEHKYMCAICKLKFNSRTEYIKHRKEEAVKMPKKVTTKSNFTCPFCKINFTSRGEYMKHRKEEARKKSTCPYCKKIMHTSRFDNHLRLIHKKLPLLKCETCGKRFVLDKLYNKHMLGHKDGFFCEICGRKCITENCLNRHIKSHEGDDKKIDCQICSKSFKRKYLYQEHMYKHTGIKPFLCSVCGVRFSSQTVFQKHTLDKHTIRSFKCELCEKCYETKKKLNDHIQRHNNLKNNECEICGQQFMIRSLLAFHVRKHNPGDKEKYKKNKIKVLPEKIKTLNCLSCNKEYKKYHKTNFQVHVRTHIGESPYLCLFCGKQFSEEDEYNFHLKVHSHETLVKVHMCIICNRAHPSKQALEIHMRIHTGEKPFHCIHCDKSFYMKNHLTQHMFWHTGKKPHSCKFCGKAFAMKGNLREHEKTHTRQRDYMCDCGKSFYTSSSLRNHQKTHLSQVMF